MFCTNCNILRSSRLAFMAKRITFSTKLDVRPNSFEDIPSPRGLPIIGTTMSLIMAGSSPKLHWYIDKRHKELGSIFKESIGPVPCVFISDPEAMRAVFAHEGKYPFHLLPEAWTTYNSMHNVSRGLFFMNGEEWLHFRRILNPLILKGEQPWMEDSCKPALDSLANKIKSFSKSENCEPNMEQLLYEWSLEIIVSVLLGPSNYIKVQNRLEKRIRSLAHTIQLIFETSSKLALIPSKLAAKYKIARWKNFEAAVENVLKSTADLVELLVAKYVKEEEGLLGKLKGQMTANELAKIVTDLLLAAGDTTAYSMEWLLFLVGKNVAVQERLRHELLTAKLEGQNYTSNTYLKNVVKESLRIYPVAPFLTRILPEPVTIKGYNIPASTVLILSIFTSGRDDKNFQNPLKFDPDRWIRNETRSGIAQSAAWPFAMGARSCVGRKLAETQLQQTLAEIVVNFEFTVKNTNDIDVVLKMVAVPSTQIKFTFKNL